MNGSAQEPLPRLGDWLGELRRCQEFEVCARIVLERALAVAGQSFEARGLDAELQRASLHLRPNDGYRGIASIECVGGTAEMEPLSSATAWRWLEQHGDSLSLDVQLGTLVDAGGEPLPEGADYADSVFDETLSGQESLERLRARRTTHVQLVPLRTPAADVVGMIALELASPVSVGEKAVWVPCSGDLTLVADVATPFLIDRPIETETTPAFTDELLPVIGARMAPLMRMLAAFAREDETVLLLGPTGAGKSRLATWCHARSPRSKGPFELVDLQTVPEEMQMAELFGWRKGAFTGAVSDREGSVGRAEKGNALHR